MTDEPTKTLWAADDLRRAFVAGAKWWEYHQTEFTMWNSDINLCEEEAEKRYPDGKPAFIPIELRRSEEGEKTIQDMIRKIKREYRDRRTD